MTKQTNKIIQGTLILSLAGLFAKILSALYRIPLNYLVDDIGVGIYNFVYPFYSILTAVALVGIPNVVSKLVAEEVAIGRYKEAHKTFKVTLLIISAFSFFVTIMMFLFAKPFIHMVGWEENTLYVIYGFAISPVFVAVSGAIRGYFQGMQIMKPSAISQVLENLTKVVVGLSLVVLFINIGSTLDKQVGGAAIGASTGVVIASIFLIITYFGKKKSFQVYIDGDKNKYEKIPFKKTAYTIISLAIPVTIAASAYSIMNLIDSVTISRELQSIGFTYDEATVRFGQMAKAFSVINVPLTISVAISASIVPAVSEAVAKANHSEVNDKISKGIKLALMFSLPSAAGLIVLAEPIFKLLYAKNPLGYEFLQYFSVCLVFMIIGQTLAGVLQGISRHFTLLLSLGIAITLKIILNLTLISTVLEARGAAISSIAYYIVFVVINYIIMKREISITIPWVNHLIKPLIGAIVMGVCVYFGYELIHNLSNSNALSVLGGVIIGMVVYFVLLVIMKAFNKEDLEAIPKTEKLVSILDKRGLL